MAPVNSISVVAALPTLSAPAATTPPLPAPEAPISLIVIFPEEVSESWALIVKLASAAVVPTSPLIVIAPVPDVRIRFFAPLTVVPIEISPLPAEVSMVAF